MDLSHNCSLHGGKSAVCEKTTLSLSKVWFWYSGIWGVPPKVWFWYSGIWGVPPKVWFWYSGIWGVPPKVWFWYSGIWGVPLKVIGQNK